MTVDIVFNRNVSVARVDNALLPDSGGHNIDTSTESDPINRHDITIQSDGDEIIVGIEINTSKLSDNTEKNIINTVPANHIATEK